MPTGQERAAALHRPVAVPLPRHVAHRTTTSSAPTRPRRSTWRSRADAGPAQARPAADPRAAAGRRSSWSCWCSRRCWPGRRAARVAVLRRACGRCACWRSPRPASPTTSAPRWPCFGLWVAQRLRPEDAQRARWSRAHYAVMRWFVAGIYRVAARVAQGERGVRGVRGRARGAERREQPVVLLSRHAGEGETLFVLHELLTRHDRGPRVVLHERFRLDSMIDVAGRAPAQPLRGPARRRHRGGDRRHGRGARGHRRAGDLPRGRELLRGDPAAGDRAPGGGRLAQAGRRGEGDEPRERAAARRHAGGDRGRAPLRTS